MRKIVYSVPKNHDALAAGASFNYDEISKIISTYEDKDIELINIDADSVMKDDSLFPKLGNDDVLLTNCGPFSWFFHMIRERKEMDFSIISDVQTALSHEYILDQSLIQDLKRPCDSTIFVSDYQYATYNKLFPETIRKDNSMICYPFMKTFPDVTNVDYPIRSTQKNIENDKADIMLGWTSRLFDAKNFKDALYGFIRSCDDNPDLDIRMNVIGHSDPIYTPIMVKKIIEKEGIDPEKYSHINNGIQLPHEKIWTHMKEMDVILFPSTGCMESLGRVILEAGHMGTPVIAAHHGATPELLSKNNLIKVEYDSEPIDIIQANPLGNVNSEKIAESCGNYEKLTLSDNSRYKDDHKILKSIITRGIGDLPNSSRPNPTSLNNDVKNFIKSIEVSMEGSYIHKLEDARKKALDTLRIVLREKELDIVKMSLNITKSLDFSPSVHIRN